MSTRATVIAANWKMHKTNAEAQAFVEELATWLGERGDALASGPVRVIVGPGFTALATSVAARHAGIEVYAQNMHEAEEGAYTGEVSARQLADVGVDGVFLGHSERRQYFAETDEALGAKVKAALAAGLAPMLCVGETDEQRESGDAERIVCAQLTTGLQHVTADGVEALTVAYEPVWAIGSGKSATPEIAQQMHSAIRTHLGELLGEAAAQRIPVLYGGSVKAGNAGELLSQPDIDGALVGGAALEVESFSGIVDAALTARVTG